MEIDRREFLKLSAAGLGGVAAAGAIKAGTALASSAAGSERQRAMLYDSTKCMGCRACQAACKQHNKLPPDPTGYNGLYDNPAQLSAKTWTLIKATEAVVKDEKELVFCKYQCMHCLDPGCVAACPVGAMQKTPEGPVLYDDKKCFGCRYCMVACPFGVPTFEWDKPLPWIRKCLFCFDKIDAGGAPACFEACPAGALKFGWRDELLNEARERIAGEPDRYIDHIYGETEAGGTTWLYLSAIPFERLGLPVLKTTAVDVNTERAMSAVPPVLLSVAAIMIGIYGITKRKKKADAAKETKR
jgi:formate dehydrogenase iron-sulfur subunit